MHIATGRSFAAPADIPESAAKYLETLFENVYKSPPWQQNMRRNMMEEIYMDGAEFTKYLAARRSEFEQFMSDMGLLKRK